MDPIKVDFSGKGKPKEVVIPPDKKILKLIINIVVTLIGGAVAYYLMLPALNFKALEFYYFIAVVIAIYIGMTFLTSKAFIKPYRNRSCFCSCSGHWLHYFCCTFPCKSI